MKVAVIGARRNNNGIGEYISKYFHANGFEICCVLGNSEATSKKASANLKRYGIEASPYTVFESMVAEQQPDVLVIASPIHTHYGYIRKGMDAGMHIFCDKPFIPPDTHNISRILDDIFDKATKNRLVIAMNSQWPFSIPFYERLCHDILLEQVETFFMRLSPLSSGREMIPDSVPHALSVLYSAVGQGQITGINIEQQVGSMDISFDYGFIGRNTKVLISLDRHETQPRPFSYGFNGLIAQRRIDTASYTQHFCRGDKTITIKDPLEASVQDFINAISQRHEPCIGMVHIKKTAMMLKHIYDACS